MTIIDDGALALSLLRRFVRVDLDVEQVDEAWENNRGSFAGLPDDHPLAHPGPHYSVGTWLASVEAYQEEVTEAEAALVQRLRREWHEGATT